MITRRNFLGAVGAGATIGAAALTGCAGFGKVATGKVVVIGAGFGGATAAKYIRVWSGYGVDVTLVDPAPEFISCPMSNLVLGGTRQLADITRSYDTLQAKYGITRVRDEVVSIDPRKQEVRLAGGQTLKYNRLIVSPGIEFMHETIPGLRGAQAQEKILHAWKAGPQTVALRRQLESMRDGGVFVMHIPLAPYRCPPGPYERACQVASYFKKEKPRSKVIILDSNEDVVSKKDLFTRAWKDLYPGIIEYRNYQEVQDVDAATGTVKLMFADVRGDVLNVIPPQRAAHIAHDAGLVTANKRWCEVDFITFESIVHPNIHVLGDALLPAPAMPKSGHMANQHAKVCADAVV